MNDNRQSVDLAIIKLSAANGNLPTVAEIEAFTSLTAITILRNIDCNEYPKELQITAHEKRILDAYNLDQDTKSICKKLNLDYVCVTNAITRLIAKGFIKRIPKRKRHKVDENGAVYIKITADVIVKVGKTSEINLKGCGGYSHNQLPNVFYVYKDRIKRQVTLKPNEYETVGGGK